MIKRDSINIENEMTEINIWCLLRICFASMMPSGKSNENRYIMHECTTKNEKARKIELTPEALEDLRVIKSRQPNATEEDIVILSKTTKIS